jgi:hypothetical protein
VRTAACHPAARVNPSNRDRTRPNTNPTMREGGLRADASWPRRANIIWARRPGQVARDRRHSGLPSVVAYTTREQAHEATSRRGSLLSLRMQLAARLLDATITYPPTTALRGGPISEPSSQADPSRITAQMMCSAFARLVPITVVACE